MKNLLQTLSISEKIGQLMQLAPFLYIQDLKNEVAGHVEALHLNEAKIFASGSVLGIGSASEMIEVQKKYLAKSRHKIPLVFMADIIHGYKTIFPVPLALAASFNPELAKIVARVSALEASTSGIHVTFSPMADLTRDPRWGRTVESFGEDPYLVGRMAAAMVEGYQHDGIDKLGNIASCVKHFAAYGASEGGRDYNTVDLSRLALHSNYLNGYKQAIEANARLVMTAFNVVEGIPSTVNTYLLRTVLRDLWHFTGVTISDYDSLKQIMAHGVASNMKEAAYLGITAGLDIEMASTAYTNHLEALIQEGKVDIRLVDEAVLRILELKNDLGLFDNPYKGADLEKAETIVLSEEFMEESLKVAHESMVLLQNKGVLPLKPQAKIALIGPYAQSRKTVGPWSWHGRRDLHATLEEVFFGQVVFCKDAVNMEDYDLYDIERIKTADVVILCLGEDERLSGEAHSRSSIDLPHNQANLLKMVKALDKPSVVVIFSGRPLILEGLLDSDAILECFFLGSKSAQAIKDVLDGTVNPSGKLPISFPRNVGQIPVYYNHLNTGRPYLGPGDHNEYVSRYLDVENTPLFPFGFGLSYSKFDYQNLSLSEVSVTPNGSIDVSIDIHNDSDRSGMETVQLYIRDHYARVSRPVKELKQFQKLTIGAHATKSVTFHLTLKDWEYTLADGSVVYDSGTFSVMVGPSSDTVLKADFTLI
jgi:beta-glucosidase